MKNSIDGTITLTMKRLMADNLNIVLKTKRTEAPTNPRIKWPIVEDGPRTEKFSSVLKTAAPIPTSNVTRSSFEISLI